MQRQPETAGDRDRTQLAPSPRTWPAQERTDRRAQEGKGLRREREGHNYCVNGRLSEEEDDEDQEQDKKADDDDVDGNEHDN